MLPFNNIQLLPCVCAENVDVSNGQYEMTFIPIIFDFLSHTNTHTHELAGMELRFVTKCVMHTSYGMEGKPASSPSHFIWFIRCAVN